MRRSRFRPVCAKRRSGSAGDSMRLWSCATNEAKTRLVNFQQDSFRLLGCDFAWRRSPPHGQPLRARGTQPQSAAAPTGSRPGRTQSLDETPQVRRGRQTGEAHHPRLVQHRPLRTQPTRVWPAASKSGCKTACGGGGGDRMTARMGCSVSSPTNVCSDTINAGRFLGRARGADRFAT